MLTSTLSGHRILILAEKETRRHLAALLRRNGCLVVECESIRQACQSLPQWQTDLVITEQRFVGSLEAILLLDHINHHDLPVLLITEFAEELSPVVLSLKDQVRHLPKPIHPLHFVYIVRSLLTKGRNKNQTHSAEETEALLRAIKRQPSLHWTDAIARDLQTLAQILSGYCTSLESQPEKSEALQLALADVRAASMQTGVLAGRLMQCLQRNIDHCDLVDVNEVSRTLHGLIARLFNDEMTFCLTTADSPCWIEAKRDWLEQVILHLAVYVRDHLPEKGKCTLAIRKINLDQVHGVPLPVLGAGKYVQLSLRFSKRRDDRAHQQNREARPYPHRHSHVLAEATLAFLLQLVRTGGGYATADADAEANKTISVYFPQAGTPEPQPDLIVGTGRGSNDQRMTNAE